MCFEFLKRPTPPLFDYDEIDDQEFDQLSKRKPSKFWNLFPKQPPLLINNERIPLLINDAEQLWDESDLIAARQVSNELQSTTLDSLQPAGGEALLKSTPDNKGEHDTINPVTKSSVHDTRPSIPAPGQSSVHDTRPSISAPGQSSAHDTRPSISAPGQSSAHDTRPSISAPGQSSAHDTRPSIPATGQSSAHDTRPSIPAAGQSSTAFDPSILQKLLKK